MTNFDIKKNEITALATKVLQRLFKPKERIDTINKTMELDCHVKDEGNNSGEPVKMVALSEQLNLSKESWDSKQRSKTIRRETNRREIK